MNIGPKTSKEIEYAEPVVAGIIRNADLVLLTQSLKWHDKFSFPGGHIRKGETIFHALQREMKEETGVDVISADLLYVDELIFPEEYYESKHFVVFVFLCKPRAFTQVKLDSEAYRHQWLALSELSKYPLVGWSRKAASKLNDKPIGHYE